MDDIAGVPLFPGQVKDIEAIIRKGFVAGLKDTIAFLAKSEEGTAAELIAGGIMQAGISDNVIMQLTNQRAAELISDAVETIESNPSKNYLAAALSVDGTLSVLVFKMDTGESDFLSAKIDIPQDSLAAELFTGVYIKKNLERLAEERKATVCWGVTEYFCDTKLR
jgi:hypothetical protein